MIDTLCPGCWRNMTHGAAHTADCPGARRQDAEDMGHTFLSLLAGSGAEIFYACLYNVCQTCHKELYAIDLNEPCQTQSRENSERAAPAERALRVYYNLTRHNPSDRLEDEMGDCIQDLIGDLLHLARRDKVEPYALNTKAVERLAVEDVEDR